MGVVHIAHLINTLAKGERTMDQELKCLHVFSCCLILGMALHSLFFFLLSEILCKFEEQEDFTAYFFVYDMTHHKFVVNHVIIINTV